MASPLCAWTWNAAPPASDAVPASSTVTIGLANSAGVSSWSLTCSAVTLTLSGYTATFVAPSTLQTLTFSSQVNGSGGQSASFPVSVLAFNSTQINQIPYYLGKPRVWKFLDPILEGVITTVGLDPDSSALAIEVINNLGTIDAALMSTAVPSAGVRAMGNAEVELYEARQRLDLCDHGRMWVSRLSSIFGVSVSTDVFGKSGYSGHDWAHGQQGRMSSLTGLG